MLIIIMLIRLRSDVRQFLMMPLAMIRRGSLSYIHAFRVRHKTIIVSNKLKHALTFTCTCGTDPVRGDVHSAVADHVGQRLPRLRAALLRAALRHAVPAGRRVRLAVLAAHAGSRYVT